MRFLNREVRERFRGDARVVLEYLANPEGSLLIIPGLSEPPARTLRATIPENESHIFR